MDLASEDAKKRHAVVVIANFHGNHFLCCMSILSKYGSSTVRWQAEKVVYEFVNKIEMDYDRDDGTRGGCDLVGFYSF